VVFALALLGFIVAAPPWPWAALVTGVSFTTVAIARQSWAERWQAMRALAVWMAGPAAFAAAAAVPALWQDAASGAPLLLRSVAASSCIGALVMTTPVFQVIGALQRSGVPPALVELVLLIHGAAALTARQVRACQRTLSWRRPPAGWRHAFDDLALVFQAVWRRTQRDVARRDLALAWRTFGRRPQVLAPAVGHSWTRVIAIALVTGMVLAAIAHVGAGGPR
jgi:hypothetical protein